MNTQCFLARPMKQKLAANVNARLDAEAVAAIQAIADLEDRSVSAVVRRLVAEALERRDAPSPPEA